MNSTLHIKNMVCDRCIMVVKDTFEQLEIAVDSVILGEVVTQKSISDKQKKEVERRLQSLGFELIENRKAQISEKIKNEITTLVYNPSGIRLDMNLSDYLSLKFNLEYSYLATVFSQQETISIEKYYILQKIERIKEFISYDELLLKQIAGKMQYSSVAHLSNQFKKITGLSPTEFKVQIKRLPIDKVVKQ